MKIFSKIQNDNLFQNISGGSIWVIKQGNIDIALIKHSSSKMELFYL